MQGRYSEKYEQIHDCQEVQDKPKKLISKTSKNISAI